MSVAAKYFGAFGAGFPSGVAELQESPASACIRIVIPGRSEQRLADIQSDSHKKHWDTAVERFTKHTQRQRS
jgi:hypothetical protein